jgi:hypothetical protein
MTTGVFESQFRFYSLCNSISIIDESIELVAVLNQKGRIIEMAARGEGVNKDLTPQNREMFFMECILQFSMYKDQDYEFGRVKSLILEREKFTIFSFEMLNYVILIVSRPVLNPIQLKKIILELIFINKELDLS